MARAASRLTLAFLALVACRREAPNPAPDAGHVVDVSLVADASLDASHVSAPKEDAAASSSYQPSPPDAVVREEHDVVVGGVTETWRLEWRHPPVPFCIDDAWSSCACAGFAFGERGELDLVRSRPREPGIPREERIHLAPLFDDGEARLARWPTLPSDAREKKPDLATLTKRPLLPVMKFADYDHDGRATELVLQVAAYACGHTPSIVVGIDRTRGLHAFTSVEAPSDPLTLESKSDWEKVAKKLPLELVSVPCGDHGAEEEIRLAISQADGGVHAVSTKKPCGP